MNGVRKQLAPTLRVNRGLRWLLIWAGLHALAFSLFTPLWQAPDEPAHVEMACLLAQRGGDLRAGDDDPALQQRLLRALAADDFWRLVRQPTPDPLPSRFADDPFLRNAGRQVGDESPLYYWLPALICRTPLALPVQVRLMRLASGLFFVAGVLAMWWAVGPLWPQAPGARMAATAAVAGLPMLAFLAGGVNNDSLAVLGGTLTFGCLLRLALPDRGRLRAALALLVTALLAAWIKKTAWFVLPLALAAIAWRFGMRGTRRQRGALIGLAALLAALALLPSHQPAAWGGRGQPWGGGLTPTAAHSGRWGMTVRDDTTQGWGRVTQTLPAAGLRGQTIRFGAWVRSPGDPQMARLTIKDDAGLERLAAPVTAEWTWLAVTRTISVTATQVLLGIAPGAGEQPGETGVLWVDDARLDGPISLVNGDFEQTVTWGSLLAQPLVQPLQQTWAASADAGPASPGRILLYLALLFPGFWGNFGWLQAPLPLPVYVLIALACLLALLGIGGELRFHRRDDPVTAVAVGWSLLAVTLSFALATAPMWVRDWQPQGRYLLPALAPWMILLVSGLRFWSRRWRLPRASVWFMAGFGLLDVVVLLLLQPWFSRIGA
ncbi:DUF2142 domain-containing protein [Candidatus Amarolinea aalborgensis]|uniref:DUF2142 domain-containing protein n=1 Tax=Candidatus Amarolinea aalborgensis TaxID=2249329 RepID=UPI003BFA0F3C